MSRPRKLPAPWQFSTVSLFDNPALVMWNRIGSMPSTKKELRSFLGLASYYRYYIPNFPEIVLPLTDLTKRKVSNILPWSIEAEEAFVKIKDELIRMPTLHTPNISRPFWLYTDASATAIGECLAQHDDVGKELPIAFFSKNPTQMKWSTIEREAFCVLEALKKFDTWVFGGKIQVVSDHNPLTYLTSNAPHGAKLSRWALALQRYNYIVSEGYPAWKCRCLIQISDRFCKIMLTCVK
ncbi:Retrovirus-related Pol polyprotein from transposon 297 [Araneus ventricosus]|uniref:RNA-directed DNA polymerase n=1 Tax=Araneus ventricosus TaxID=182803 RepID=A0A4Y2AAK3_ARAVE|nr:Retrovirus-related Pol polyprotein from transposon 297 [Araneus ventricosus]